MLCGRSTGTHNIHGQTAQGTYISLLKQVRIGYNTFVNLFAWTHVQFCSCQFQLCLFYANQLLLSTPNGGATGLWVVPARFYACSLVFDITIWFLTLYSVYWSTVNRWKFFFHLWIVYKSSRDTSVDTKS